MVMSRAALLEVFPTTGISTNKIIITQQQQAIKRELSCIEELSEEGKYVASNKSAVVQFTLEVHHHPRPAWMLLDTIADDD